MQADREKEMSLIVRDLSKKRKRLSVVSVKCERNLERHFSLIHFGVFVFIKTKLLLIFI